MLKILQRANERLPDLVTNILSQNGFVSTAGYDDESDEEESDRNTVAQNNQITRDAGAPKKTVIRTQVPETNN